MLWVEGCWRPCCVTLWCAAKRAATGTATRHLVGLVRELRRVEAADPATLAVEDRDGQQSGCAWVALEIPSPAEHIRLESPADNVMVVKLCAGGSQIGARELIGELRQAFAWIRQGGGCIAIVLASEYEEFVPGAEQGPE